MKQISVSNVKVVLSKTKKMSVYKIALREPLLKMINVNNVPKHAAVALAHKQHVAMPAAQVTICPKQLVLHVMIAVWIVKWGNA